MDGHAAMEDQSQETKPQWILAAIPKKMEWWIPMQMSQKMAQRILWPERWQ
jgi:hypothetical protein